MKQGAPRIPHLDFLVIGAYKSGTTTVQAMLRRHPQIFVPSRKEPSWWAVPLEGQKPSRPIPAHAVRDLDEYTRLFDRAPGDAIVGEVSPEYLPSETAAEKVARLAGQVRIVAVLRDPVERAWSDWQMYVRQGRERLSFLDALREQKRRAERGDPTGFYLSTGMYATQLERWFAFVPENRRLVLLFDDLVRDPVGFATQVFSFLGVDPGVQVDTTPRKPGGLPDGRLRLMLLRARRKAGPLAEHIPAHVRRRLARAVAASRRRPAPLPEEVRRIVGPFFEAEIARLEELLGRDLGAWRR